jgi:hypothetical protein
MAKSIVTGYYTFDPATATVTIPNRIIPRDQLILVVNQSSNAVMYNFSDPDLSLESYTVPYETTGTRFVLNYDTGTMSSSDPIMIMSEESAQDIAFDEVIQDPTNKLRVAQPQSLIDTDFEYGLQPIKWECFGTVQNIPSFFYRGGGNGLNVSTITGGNQNPRSTVTVTTLTPHGLVTSDVVHITQTTDADAEGSFQLLTTPSTTQFTYLAKGNVNGNVATPYSIIEGGGLFDSNNQSSNLVTTTIVSDNATVTSTLLGSMLTVTTTGRHGLFRGSPILIRGSTTANANGSWYIYDVPTTTTFRILTSGVNTGTSIVNTSAAAVFVNPEVSFVHRAGDGGVLINTGTIQEGIQAVRQTRRYFRYQSGKGITMSTGTKFTPTLDVNSIVASGTSVSVTVQQPLSFASGVSVIVTGVETNAGTTNYYNGTFEVQSVDPVNRTFTYHTPTANADTSPGGEPLITLRNFKGASIRAGMFDYQNGFYFEYDGETVFVVKRDSTKELIGSVTATNGSVTVTGASTKFSKQVQPGDYVVIRGQSYQITSVDSDTSMSIAPKYRGPTVAGARINITRNLKIPQSQWNLDKCDGDGPSGFLLDITKMQMCYIDYTWYGAGTIRFGMRGTNGDIIYLHKIANNNRNYAAYMRSGNLPARYEINNIGPYSRLISGDTGARGASLGASDSTLVVADAEYWPDSGAIAVQQDNNVEVMSYGSKTRNTNFGGWNLIGLDRRALGGTTGNVTFTCTEFDGGTAGASSVASVTFVGTNCAPVISHWGTSVIMDGGYDDDRSIVFSYGKRTATTVNGNTSIAVLAIRLAPSVDNSITGVFGAREIVNRMQLKLASIGTNSRGPLLITGILNPTRFTGAGAPSLPAVWAFTSVVSTIGAGSLAQVIDMTSNNTTVQGGEQIFSFFADAGTNTYELGDVRDLGTGILSGDGSNATPGFPNGPDVLVIVANSVTSTATVLSGVRVSWTEAQA